MQIKDYKNFISGSKKINITSTKNIFSVECYIFITCCVILFAPLLKTCLWWHQGCKNRAPIIKIACCFNTKTRRRQNELTTKRTSKKTIEQKRSSRKNELAKNEVAKIVMNTQLDFIQSRQTTER